MTTDTTLTTPPFSPLARKLWSFRFVTAATAALTLSTATAGEALAAPAADPVNLVYSHEFFVDPMTFDPSTGMLSQHFSGNLYLPPIVGDNQLISTSVSRGSDVQVAVDGTWVFDPSSVAIDPANPPPVLQWKPDPALSRVRFAFKDGSVFELIPSAHPVLSVHFALGGATTADGSANYNFLFTETDVLLKEIAGKGRHAGMVGTYTFHNSVTMVGPNFQVHSRGITLLTLKKP